MLPIIENSFKHTLMQSPGQVNIKLRITSDEKFISLYVENDLFKNGKIPSNGKGLASVKRQLEMLYESKFVFHTKSEHGKFKTFLKVPIMKTDE
jgi:LytS/YehU family sensor histidine kinase